MKRNELQTIVVAWQILYKGTGLDHASSVQLIREVKLGR